MRVAMCGLPAHPSWPGGEPAIVRSLARGFQKNGITTCLIHDNDFIKSNKLKSAFTKLISGYFSYDFYRTRFSNASPDICLGFADWDFSYIFAARDLEIPVALHMGIYWLICPKWILFNWKKLVCEGPGRLKCSYCVLKTRRLLLLLRMRRFFLQRDKLKDTIWKIIAPSVFVSRILEVAGFKKDKIITIENGIDLNKWKFYSLLQTTKKTILFSSPCTEQKGIQYFVELARQLRYRSDLQFIATGNPVARSPANLQFVGWKPENEVVDLINKSYVVVVPSVFEEPFGLVATQAMAVGRPVVIFDSGGLREQVKDGINGFVVKRGDIHCLKERVVELADNPGLAAEMGERGREIAYKRFNEEGMIRKYIDVIKA